MAISVEPRLDGIAQLLNEKKYFSKSKLLEFQTLALANQQSLVQYLISNHLITAHAIASTIAEYFYLPLVDLDNLDLSTIPFKNEQFIHHHQLLPLAIEDRRLIIAIDDPVKQLAFNEIQFHTGLGCKAVIVEMDKLNQIIGQLANKKQQNLTVFLDNSIELDNLELEYEKNKDQPVFAKDDDAPIIKFINEILLNAIKKGASDIHFEPYEQQYRIRYRQDGLLTIISTPSLSLACRISTRLKVIANLDIAERRVPQDGRFQMKLSVNHVVDCRVSTCPIIHGEKVVVRILDSHLAPLDIDTLGLNILQKEHFLAHLNKPQGLILVTGPTGSGKTVSLYTALKLLNSPEKNISTVEDPVEIKIPGINQVTINPKSGLTFSRILRSFLRQDPDVIMIGEIRDLETAEIAIKAAQTGHLVLSTLHTNNAAETLTRLTNIGIPSFNIANSLSLLIAQRLARRLCPHCKIKVAGTNECQAIGCKQCNKGYRGRIALFEVIVISKKMGQLIMSGANSIDIFEQAKSEGMLTLYQAGLEKVEQGLTTIEEINRVIVE